MSTARKITCTALTAAMLMTSSPTLQASSLRGVLDGMFANVTAPDMVSSQFGGAIAAGGAYVRSPITSLQLLYFDPPRIDMGCGGIDLYLGSFSFISAEKLTQFFRSVAQNVAPLAFKMAIEQNFPNLAANLQKFQAMAQSMNEHQRNSCQLAQGIVTAFNDASKEGDKTKTLSNIAGSVKGWFTDFTESVTNSQAKPSESTSRARNLKNPDGTRTLPHLGNLTWNALQERKEAGGIAYNIVDDATVSMSILMTLIGTKIIKEGANDDAQPLTLPVEAQRARLKDLFRPSTGASGNKEIGIWSCTHDTRDCLAPRGVSIQTTGIEGYVRRMMLGDETATVAADDSIVGKIQACSERSCGITGQQRKFLNALIDSQAVAMLTRVQRNPNLLNAILPKIMNFMVDDISVVYGRAVIDLARVTYANGDMPRPDDFLASLTQMEDDLKEADARRAERNDEVKKLGEYIDMAFQSAERIIRFRPQ